MVLIPEIRSIDFSIPISSVSSILFLVEPKRTGYKCLEIIASAINNTQYDGWMQHCPKCLYFV